MFSSVFAGSASRGPMRSKSSSSAVTLTTAEGKLLADSKRLAPIESGAAVVQGGGNNGNGINGSGASSTKKKKRSRKRTKKRSPWLSAPMILGSEVASNIA